MIQIAYNKNLHLTARALFQSEFLDARIKFFKVWKSSVPQPCSRWNYRYT